MQLSTLTRHPIEKDIDMRGQPSSIIMTYFEKSVKFLGEEIIDGKDRQ